MRRAPHVPASPPRVPAPVPTARRWLVPVLVLAGIVLTAMLANGSADPGVRRLPARWQKGANFTAWWHDAYSDPGSDRELAALRATGSDSAALIVTWYMRDRRASTVAPDPRYTPTDASLLHAMAVARELGMRVVLKPHIDVRDGHSRTDLRPLFPARWLASYRAMLDHYAQLAQQGRAQMLVIGTELTSMAGYTTFWRGLIADARSRFGGALTFAANWIDGAESVRFWSSLDYIGVDFYMPLGTRPHAGVTALERGWKRQRYVQRLATLHRRYRRPVILTEIGFASRGDPRAQETPTSTAADQRAAYEATYRVWAGVPWFAGLYWWDWRAGDRTDSGGFDPQGQPAASVMRSWNGSAPAACTLAPNGRTGATGPTGPGAATGPTLGGPASEVGSPQPGCPAPRSLR